MSKRWFVTGYALIALCLGFIALFTWGTVESDAGAAGPLTCAVMGIYIGVHLLMLYDEGWWPKRKPEPLQTHSAIVTLLQLRGEHLLKQGDKR